METARPWAQEKRSQRRMVSKKKQESKNKAGRKMKKRKAKMTYAFCF